MMIKSTTFRLSLIGAALVAVLSGTAYAGLKSNSTVFINTATRVANGSLGAARNTADAVQHIGCYTNAFPASVTTFCQARNAAGTSVSCSTSSANLVAVVRGMTGDSHLWFSWDAAGTCTEIDVYNVSQTPPKSH
jgi:hypothetical protein